MLDANWREGRLRNGTPYAFTCPAPPRYRHQWHWDSCFHAIAWSLFEPSRGREELRTLLRSGRADGFLPHTAFWDRHPGWRRAPFYATASFATRPATETIGPPLLAVAWERVAQASGDCGDAFAEEGVGPLAAHLDWLARERDPDRTGLLSIVLPDESGLDDAPQYDAVFGRHAHYRPGYFRLVHRYRRLGWDGPAILRAGDLHLKDVLVNVAYALSLHALARLSGEARWAQRAQRVEQALVDQCLDPATGLFCDLAGRDREPVRVSTWSALSPLALPGIGEDVRRRLVEEHLLDPRRYAAPCGIPSVSMEEPSFQPDMHLWRCWRGPSWVNTAWLLVPAMRELGYTEQAGHVVGSLAAAIGRNGFREYYQPLTGHGLAARGFAWSALIADLLQ